MKKILVLFTIIPFLSAFAQTENEPINTDYKSKMYNPAYNFYNVVTDAEAYFSTIDKFKKGSGYKPFQRWVNANEYKYYPDGDRTTVDPYFAENQFKNFLKNNPTNKNLFSGSWRDLGPYSIDSVTGHYSAGLGRIEDFYVSPRDSNKMYFGSRSGGFWRTTNGGTSWTGTTDQLMASGVNAIAVSPTNSDSVLINVRNANNGTSHGIFKSSDGGVTFTATGFAPATFPFGGLGTNFQVYELAYHPNVANLVFVGTNEGIFRSTNNLQTITRILPSSDVIEIAFHPTNNNIIYAYANNSGSQSNQIFRSVNGGTSFQRTNVISGNNNNSRVELATSPVCPSCVYFASNNGIWKSVDDGFNFSFISNSSTQTNGGFAVSDVDTSYMVYGYLDLDNSSDGGRTFVNRTRWSLGNTNGNTNSNASSYRTSTNYIHADVRNLKSINGVFYAATDGFLCKSNDNGVTWQVLSEGTGIRENYKLGLSQSNYRRSISGSQDNGTSILTEKGWVEFYGADGMEGLIHPLNENWMLASIQYGGRRRTKNGGASQDGVSPSGSSNAYWEAPLAYDPNNHLTIYDFRNVVYKSDDFAETYTSLGDPSSITGDIRHAAIAENNSNIIVVAADRYIEKSTNGGLTFSSIKNNLPNYSIQDIAFDPNNDDVMIVVYARYQSDNQKVYLTTNGGTSWTNITYNLGSMPIRSVVIDHTDAANIYLGAEIGVFTKPMNATNWSLYSNGLPNVAVRELEINYGSNVLKAATWGRGLWEYNLVGRAAHPAVVYTTITSPPTESTPKVGVDQYVTSKIHYNGTLSSVYLEWSQDSAVFGNSIAMTNTVDSTWVSNQAIPQFPVGTKMYFKVFAVGTNNDTSETYKFMYELTPFEYCTATGNNGSGNLYLDNVNLKNLNNSTVNNVYTDYVNPIVELFADSTYTLNLSANTGWGNNDFGAWIDFNNDSDFDVSERILYNANNGGSASNNFTVPSAVSIGDTVRMRVRLSYWSDPEPCGNQFGEVEDYRILLNGFTTSLGELNDSNDVAFTLYPNPNDGNFTIDFKDNGVSKLIRIYDSQGRLVKEIKQNRQGEIDFNLNLPNGSYVIVVKSGKAVETIPIVINK